MSVEIKIDGYCHPEEYDALSAYFANMAELTRARHAQFKLAEPVKENYTGPTPPEVKEAPAEQPAAEQPAAEETKPKRTRAKAEVKPQISTGEERVNPDEEQDKADEKAEAEAVRKELVIDDVKNAVNRYVQKFTLAAAQADGPAIFVSVLGNPPEGEAYWKMSLIPRDQDTLAKVCRAWELASSEDDRFGA